MHAYIQYIRHSHSYIHSPYTYIHTYSLYIHTYIHTYIDLFTLVYSAMTALFIAFNSAKAFAASANKEYHK